MFYFHQFFNTSWLFSIFLNRAVSDGKDSAQDTSYGYPLGLTEKSFFEGGKEQQVFLKTVNFGKR